METPTAINIHSLSKSYGSIHAVNDVSLTVQQGELFGLIGPDGAGKTTLMRILCGLLTPDSGKGAIFQFDIHTQVNAIHEIIGYMPQRFSLYPDLTVAENLRFFADLFQVEKKEREQRFQRLMTFSRLGPFQSRRAQDLSGGMKQKLALSCTLIHTPQLIILDEPTTGVDPVSRHEFWTILKELRAEGVTLLVSTPYMDEAMLCDRVAFMHRGRIMAIDQPAHFARSFSHELLEIDCDDRYSVFSRLEALPSVKMTQLFGDKIHIAVTSESLFRREIKKHEITLHSIRRIEPGIEDVFIELMQSKEHHEKSGRPGY